jgi:hypothetical protein
MTSNTTIYSEYVVTLKDQNDLEQFYMDMETPGGSLYIPDRAVSVKHRRPNSRNTHYYLTGSEAELVKGDSRVLSVIPAGLIDASIRPSYTKTGNFYRGAPSDDQVINWGLLRSIDGYQHPNWGSDGDPSYIGTITYNALGENVDVIVIDGHIDPNHPEFAINENGSGGSRVIQFDWNTLSGAAGLLDGNINDVLTDTYRYAPYDSNPDELEVNNHGCHVAGTLAGNTQGWAKKANIYNISPYAQYNQNVVNVNGWSLIIWDYIRAFHASKPINPITGKKNPTICNCSYGTVLSFPNDYGSFQTGPITRVYYRGTWHGNPLVPLTDSDLISYGLYPINGVVSVPYFDTAQAADIEDAISEGIIIVGAAGNNYTRMVKPGDTDYNNIISASINGIGFNQYCHQGMTPGAAQGVICVGAATAKVNETKSHFSNCGPRVDLFAPGEYILSSVNLYGEIADSRNTDYSLSSYSGTSMASPQVAGAIACNLQTNPNLTPQALRNYINIYSKVNQLSSGSGGASDTTDLQQAPNKYLFFEPIGTPLDSVVVSSTLSFPLKTPITPVSPVIFTGGKAPFTIGIYPPLPAGLTFNTASGEISGTPTEFRFAYDYTVTITDSIGQVTSKSFSLEVTEALGPDLIAVINTSSVTHLQYVPVTPYIPISYTGAIPPVELSISSTLPLGLSFSTSTGQITGLPLVPSTATNYAVTISDSTRRVTTGSFTLSVLESPKLVASATTSTFVFTKDVEVAPVKSVVATSGYGTYTYAISPSLPNGLTFNTSTSFISGTPLSASSINTYSVVVTDVQGQSETVNFGIQVLQPNAIVISTVTATITCLQYVTNLNIAPILATGGYQSLSYSITPELPSLLAFNADTGYITGIANDIVDQTYTVTVTDLALQSESGTFRLVVQGSANAIVTQFVSLTQWNPIISPIKPAYITGGGAKKYEILEPLPSGLIYNTSTGFISGTPYQSLSTSSFTAVITNVVDGISSKKFSLYVEENNAITRGFITPSGLLFTATVNSSVNTFVSAVGTGTTFEILTGELPPGLTLNSNGVISGTITT